MNLPDFKMLVNIFPFRKNVEQTNFIIQLLLFLLDYLLKSHVATQINTVLINIFEVVSFFYDFWHHFFVTLRHQMIVLFFPGRHYARLSLCSDEMDRCAEVLFADQAVVCIVIRVRTLMPALSDHQHVWIVDVCADLVDDQLVEQLIVTEPIEILEKNRTEVHPDSSMLLDKVNTQNVGFFVDCLPVAFADDLLKAIVIWKVIFYV